MDRRTFLHMAATAALLGSLPAGLASAGGKSRVVRILCRGSRSPSDAGKIRAMLSKALTLLTGAEEPVEAWRGLFSPDDVVGIKVNCLAGPGISTTPALVEGVAEALSSIGISRERIIVWDRNDRDLALGGFRPGESHPLYSCFGTDRVGFSNELYEKRSVGSLVSRILAEKCTAIINMPVLKDHGIAGVSIGMKNYFGAIHNPNKYHPNGGDPYIADLNSLDLIRKKQRLVICDCTRIQYHAGPAFDPRWNVEDGSVMVATDPVALDAVGTRIIERKRSERGLPSLGEEKRGPTYIETAAKLGLGRMEPEEIDLVEEVV